MEGYALYDGRAPDTPFLSIELRFGGFWRINGGEEGLKAAFGDHVTLEEGVEMLVLQGFRDRICKCFSRFGIVAQSKIAANDVFEKAHGMGMRQIIDHQTKNVNDGMEAFIGMTNIGQSDLIQEDFLHDENGDGLGEFRAVLHNAQAKRNNLGGEKEVDHLSIVRRIDGFVSGGFD